MSAAVSWLLPQLGATVLVGIAAVKTGHPFYVWAFGWCVGVDFCVVTSRYLTWRHGGRDAG